MKKLLLAGTTVLLMVTSAAAQSALYNIVDGNQTCVWVGSPPTMHCFPHSAQSREKMVRAMARAKAIRECRAYGNCGQQRSR